MIETQREEVIAHLDRITSSRTFATSPRLIEFLRFCVETSIHGDAAHLKESTIGVSVFGRPPDYDPKLDPIVRVHARRLREKLESFYKTEGHKEEILVEIRKGGYVPTFVSRLSDTQAPLPEAATADEPLPQPMHAIARTFHPSWAWAAATALVVLLTAFVVGRWSDVYAAVQPTSSHLLWREMFHRDQETLLVPGDSGLVIYQGLSLHQTNLDAYLRGDYRTMAENEARSGATSGLDLGSRRYTSIVDLQAATGLTQTALAEHGSVKIRFARDVRPNDLKSGNAVLIGAAEANPWVELFERNMNFALKNNLQTHVFTVVNRSPRQHEPTHWDSALSDPERSVYGVVAFLPNLAGNGNTLILEGTSMAGTEAAWDFVTDDTRLLPFLNSIRRKDGSLPHFELVLGTYNMGASAVHSNLLCWRTSN